MQSYVQHVLEACDNAKTVSCYVSLSDEVDTREILQRLSADGVTVVVPVCIPGTKEMKMMEFKGFETCESNEYGILEPKGTREVSKELIDVCIVPGTLFDSLGNRKGRGHGYYDRYLVDFVGKRLVGLCFEDQLVESLKTRPWDVPVDSVIVASR